MSKVQFPSIMGLIDREQLSQKKLQMLTHQVKNLVQTNDRYEKIFNELIEHNDA